MEISVPGGFCWDGVYQEGDNCPAVSGSVGAILLRELDGHTNITNCRRASVGRYLDWSAGGRRGPAASP